MKFKQTLLAFAIFIASPVHAQEPFVRWAVGPVASTSPGISVLYLFDPLEGYHFSAFLNDSDRTVFTFDWQKYFGVGSNKTPIAPWGNISAYSGIGLQSVSRIEQAEANADMRVPIGIEFSAKQLPVQVFGDVAAIIGPLPKTNFNANARVGIRAVF